MIKDNKSIVTCLAGAVLVFAKMYTNNNAFMALFLALICLAILRSRTENKLIYVIFFSTWAYVIKFNMKSHSMLVVICAVYIVDLLLLHNKEIMGQIKKEGKSSSYAALFMMYSFMFSLMGGAGPTQVLGVLLNYTCGCLGIYLLRDSRSVKKYIMAYAISMLVQCIIAYVGKNYIKEIGEYFKSFTSNQTLITDTGVQSRFKGFDADPNYFATQILVAVTTLFLVALYEKKKVMPIVMAAILAAFGLMSVSKMYLLTLGLILVLAVVFVSRKNLGAGVGAAIFIAIAGGIIYWQMGDQFIAAFTSRLEGVQDINGLTTGRANYWLDYLDGIWANLRILLIGAGYGSGLYNNHGAHNGYITLWYFWGFIGSILYIIFIKNLYRSTRRSLMANEKLVKLIDNLPLVVLLIVNFALDCPIMDFFAIAMFMAIISRYYGQKVKSI